MDQFGTLVTSTHGLVAMTSASHAEGRQFDPGWVYITYLCIRHVGADYSSAAAIQIRMAHCASLLALAEDVESMQCKNTGHGLSIQNVQSIHGLVAMTSV